MRPAFDITQVPVLGRALLMAMIVVSAHVPIPWGHDHADMQPELLAQHIQQHHPLGEELPRGWHVHFTLVEADEQVALLEGRTSANRGDLAGHTARPLAFGADSITRLSHVRAADYSIGRLASSGLHLRQTYKRLQVLLI